MACSAASDAPASETQSSNTQGQDTQAQNTKAQNMQSKNKAAQETPSLVPPLPDALPDETSFTDVLTEYQRMNERLDRVSARLRLANADLCPEVFRDPGFNVHTLEDYPERLKILAQDIMGLEPDGIYIRSVRQGSPAELADIQAGDRLLSLNGKNILGGKTMKRFYAALSREAFGGVQTRLKLRAPEGNEYETTLRSDTACDYGTHVFNSQNVNGHTDGQDVYITSELMRLVRDDTNLALIVAHEMSHAIAGHIDLVPSANLELEADRMALVLMENAGYDIDSAIEFWADAAHPHRDLQDNSESHPTITARYENLKTERARIMNIRTRQQNLTFN